MKHRFLMAGLSLAGSLCQAQAVVGKPCLFSDYFAEWRTFPSILRDPEGNLTCGRNRLNCGGATQGPPAAGDPAATAVRRTSRTGPQGHFTYRDRAGNIQDLWFDRHREKDRWHVEQLNNGGRTLAPAAAGDPSGAEIDGDFHVAYRDLAGGIQSLCLGREWHAQLLNRGGATSAPMAAGEPVQLVLDGIRHVLYRDGLGNIHDLWFNGAWHAEQVNNGGATQAPAAVGDPAAVAVAGARHISYRDGTGGIQDVWFDGSWHHQRLNVGGRTQAPLAQGNPCARVVDGGVLHVTYRDLAARIQDLRFDGVWRVQCLNDGRTVEAPPAASDPVCLAPPSNWEYVAYVDTDGNAQLLSHTRNRPWRATWLNAPDLSFWGGKFFIGTGPQGQVEQRDPVRPSA
jgi:hypothetical protein